MAGELVAKIMSVVDDDDVGGYVVEFWVGREFGANASVHDAFALLGNLDSLQRESYTMLVGYEDEQYTMEPDDALAECLIVYDQCKSCEGMLPVVKRQWQTGKLTEWLCMQLVSANLFGSWSLNDIPQSLSSGSGLHDDNGEKSADDTSRSGLKIDGDDPLDEDDLLAQLLDQSSDTLS